MGAPQAQTRFEQLDFFKCNVSFSCPSAERVLVCLAVHKIISDGVYSEHTNTRTYISCVEYSSMGDRICENVPRCAHF